MRSNEAPGGIGTFLYSYICGPCAAGDVAEFVEPGSWLFRCCCPCCCCLACKLLNHRPANGRALSCVCAAPRHAAMRPLTTTDR